MMFSLNETIICVKHNTIIEENENRTKVESLGTLKAEVSTGPGYNVYICFHAMDQEKILDSTMLIWARGNGKKIALIPTLDLRPVNEKFMRLRARIADFNRDTKNEYDMREMNYDAA